MVRSSANVNADISGNESVLFIGDKTRVNGYIDLLSNTLCYIGNRSSFENVNFRIYEIKNIIVGDDNMFSWGIRLSTCDHHLIFDIYSHKMSNFSKSIYIGDHCWVAQESAILKGVFMANESILRAKAVAE